MEHTRGFVTIATGNERYFKLACNLLYSYKHFSKDPYPFAIITDRENEYTQKFDKTIVISDPHNSYMDKLILFREMPFQETIFIDADSLAYGDLNVWWDMFSTMGDFSLFGYAWRNLSTDQGWFNTNGMKEYKDKITFVPSFNGGVYYMRKTPICEKVFSIANDAARNYSDYAFNVLSKAADEPVLALAMAVCECEPLDLPEIAFAPKKNQIEADISVPTAVYKRSCDNIYPVNLIHWSNYLTRKALYRFEVSKLMFIRNNPEQIKLLRYKFLYEWKVLYQFMRIFDLAAFLSRILSKLKKRIRTNKK